jgi:nitroreductase
LASLGLSADEVLMTTRAVRKRLDLTRPVEREVIDECLDLAAQAPTGRLRQRWHFVVVDDPGRRRALADLYRRAVAEHEPDPLTPADISRMERSGIPRMTSSTDYLLEHLHEVPVHVVPCIEGRPEGKNVHMQAGFWGAILPAVWSFMLAARARGLGTVWTTTHLFLEREAAGVLEIPYERVTQAALIPLAYTIGTEFKRGSRVPREEIVHRNRWRSPQPP